MTIDNLDIRYSRVKDLNFLLSIDKHIKKDKYIEKIKNNESILTSLNNENIWFLRFNYFWDEIPFLNLIFIKEKYRGKWFWKKILDFWELEMKELWYKKVMTSSLSNEKAQNFYRKNWYKDIWWFIINNEPNELLFLKEI